MTTTAAESTSNGVGFEAGQEPEVTRFDFEAHRQQAVQAYLPIRARYEQLAEIVRHILMEASARKGIKVRSVESRAMDIEGLAEKASRPASDDPEQPQYRNPLADITDLAGARVITVSGRDRDLVEEVIREEFELVEPDDAATPRMDERGFGYRGLELLARLGSNRTGLPEYHQYAGLACEIQVRTALQHAWAEIEQDIQYKSALTTPAEIRRRYAGLAGILEIADRELGAIEDASKELQQEAISSIQTSRLAAVDITAQSLKAYLDRKWRPDERVTTYAYDYAARLVRQLGFETLSEIDDAISSYDDETVSKALWGNRQGQVMRFEGVLIAAMGERYVERHPLSKRDTHWAEVHNVRLGRLRTVGITIGSYDPDEARAKAARK